MYFITTIKTTLQKTKVGIADSSTLYIRFLRPFQADTRRSNLCASKSDKISRFLSLIAAKTGT